MIGAIFTRGNEVVFIRVNGNSLSFKTESYGSQFVPIEALKFSKEGVIKEFPDLETEKAWQQIAVERFKENLKRYKTESAKIKYIIDDLKKYGYVLKGTQKQGERMKRE